MKPGNPRIDFSIRWVPIPPEILEDEQVWVFTLPYLEGFLLYLRR